MALYNGGVNQTPFHTPFGEATSGYSTVTHYNILVLGISTRLTQICSSAYQHNQGLWFREKHDATWSSWKQILTPASALNIAYVYWRDKTLTEINCKYTGWTSNIPGYVGSSNHRGLYLYNTPFVPKLFFMGVNLYPNSSGSRASVSGVGIYSGISYQDGVGFSVAQSIGSAAITTNTSSWGPSYCGINRDTSGYTITTGCALAIG